MKPPKLLRQNARLVAYIPNLPYQEGNHLSPIAEEGTGSTKIATYYPDESYTNRYVYMADVGNGSRENKLLEDISVDDLIANVGNEDEAQHIARREKNRERA